VAPFQRTLLTNHAFRVGCLARSPETDMAWKGRVEYVVSGQGMHVDALSDSIVP
jgi:hypothetical protein